jgi:hypothetical protein
MQIIACAAGTKKGRFMLSVPFGPAPVWAGNRPAPVR